ncbi:MAG TPA: ornithine--oxo-acid transaminase [Oligoflexia bacterium]|nr:ornithine--oxo-acid transaminase [Oligoflexia bacterium]HMP26768.1 ornithine--oxo-acid transaminase [Oligoflexia bacterium]
MNSSEIVNLHNNFAAINYAPLEVVLSKAEGCFVWDLEGNKYIDFLSCYSALSFGHRHPDLIKAAKEQLDRLTLTGRAFITDQLALFSQELAAFCQKERVLLMNSGAEAVETAIKIARRWGYEQKRVASEMANIICFAGNFHGRTTTIISFSDSRKTKDNFGPYTPGFKLVPFGLAEEVKRAIDQNTVAVLCEPIQGEGGIITPPAGFLTELRKICTQHNILFIADEIQTGLCRTGRRFACDHEEVIPDLYILGKALGGGIVPVSAVVGNRKFLDVLKPGSHGSTFGGNPFAAAIGRTVIKLIKETKPEKNAENLGSYLFEQLKGLKSPIIADIRGKGLLIGVDIDEKFGVAKDVCKKLLKNGVLSYDTREKTIRLAPPLTITRSELDYGLERIALVFR